MTDQKSLKEFPDLSNKLSAPTKKSLFERQRAEAEAKRLREEAETAAVLNDFVKSFDNNDEDDTDAVDGTGQGGRPRLGGNGFDGPRASAGPSKRHFTSSVRSSGPGSLGPPSGMRRPRASDGPTRPEDRRKDKGIFTYDDSEEPSGVAAAFRSANEEDSGRLSTKEDERAAPKPTMQLSCLPPGTSPAVIKSLIPTVLKVEGVRMLMPTAPGQTNSSERKSISAIVTLASETPANDIDTVVTTLQNQYLGWGYNLSISRHLSSAAMGSSMKSVIPALNLNSASASLPFNAQLVQEAAPIGMNRAGPSAHRGGIAPPSSYNHPQQFQRGPPPVEVKVNPPNDIKQLKLIHRTLEALLTHGPEFEALLMTRPEVQKDEKWAWIWNPRSIGGIWYRWRLWELLTGLGGSSKKERSQFKGNTHSLFDGAAMWTESEESLSFEYTIKFEDFVSDSDYNSSDEDESGDEDGPRKRRKQFGAYAGKGAPPEGILSTPSEEQTYLNPLQKAKFTHLLARLPNSTAKLRKGDVARVTAFAISHAGRGSEEVVQMLVSNIVQPVSYSRHANPERERDGAADSDAMETKDESTGLGSKPAVQAKEDTTPSTLVALYCLSDILSASSTAGVRHSWRYRALIEHVLKARKVLTYLGKLEKIMGWGRLRAEKWRRSIQGVLERWEQWSVFSAETQAAFVLEFEDALKKGEEEQSKSQKDSKLAKGLGKSKWKAVEAGASAHEVAEEVGEPMDVDVKSGFVAESDKVSSTNVKVADPQNGGHDHLSQKLTEVKPSEQHNATSSGQTAKAAAAPSEAHGFRSQALPTAPVSQRRPRPKAEDMFADSDGE